ncbi:3-phosphoserine/phosphohydroxythreonine transaminase [Bacillus sp. B15-48]|uniref:3-phosphoserine/phosphohydroxythreonine transaminase n=1 Tax=Bacillus sp. B15-48 TaxID=1548601 RepID=UPI00193ED36B|nr:3-phosphoserine/phosphohydroxythreonine transaminase [Bacillus sp. B15-48]MBM4764169.1 3-phosphoserine/phosphohydroxythreonine transaminase [Bacillus sp. B15-48]
MTRAYNFNAGPTALPEAVLKKAEQEWMNYNGTGMNVMEMSHRSKPYEEINDTAQSLLRKLLNIPDDYEVLFLQGGASLQFTMVPMNLLEEGKKALYVLTGSWSEKALKEAKKIGATEVVSSGKDGNYKQIPTLDASQLSTDGAYVHITSNNTIYGTQWHNFPDTQSIPLVADMSSDIMCRPIDVSKFGLIYAGAQKNLGPSGVTVVIVKKELLERSKDSLPTMLDYRTQASNNSLYNTPPTLAVYLLKLVLEWADSLGGAAALEKLNKQKADLLYNEIDGSNGFYKGHAELDSRSLMNVTFTLENQELTDAFLAEAKQRGFTGLNGHRSVGGCRASIYNAVPLEHVEVLAQFMKEFRTK